MGGLGFLKFRVFWDVTLCRLLDISGHFELLWCLRLQREAVLLFMNCLTLNIDFFLRNVIICPVTQRNFPPDLSSRIMG